MTQVIANCPGASRAQPPTIMHTQAQIIELLINALPYPNQIKDIDMSSEAEAVRFTWRGIRYRVDGKLNTDEVDKGCLVGSDLAILLRQCLNQSLLLKA